MQQLHEPLQQQEFASVEVPLRQQHRKAASASASPPLSSSTSSRSWIPWFQHGSAASIAGLGNSHDSSRSRQHSRTQLWLIRLSTTIFLWTCFIQIMSLADLWHPQIRLSHLGQGQKQHISQDFPVVNMPTMPMSLKPRPYKSNGYLLVSCNGGLNQMRAAICDMVSIAKCLNITLVVPELDKRSFWEDPSDFKDIFDVNHFIGSLQNDVQIVKSLPRKYQDMVSKGEVRSMPPISWSNHSYYLNQILPLIKSHKVLHFVKSDARLANNGLPIWMQKLRCQVNYEALRFTSRIENLGQKLVKHLREEGPFVVLHLRYEMDMLAFSGCTHGCTDTEADELTKLRFSYPWWREKKIDSIQKRLDGLCPLTPEETALVLQALGFQNDTLIYIAAGEVYGGTRRMAALSAAFPNIVRKETILSQDELRPFLSHSSQMAALDYMVSIESDVFIPTYDGNMAKVVQGHRRYLGHRETILPDRKRLVGLFDQLNNGTLNWQNFSLGVQEVQKNHTGAPARRKVLPDRPKEEDYFYSNPEECLS